MFSQAGTARTKGLLCVSSSPGVVRRPRPRPSSTPTCGRSRRLFGKDTLHLECRPTKLLSVTATRPAFDSHQAAAGLPRDNTVKTQLRSSPDCRSLCWKCHNHQIPLYPCREYLKVFITIILIISCHANPSVHAEKDVTYVQF